jgi:hypothetical protein
MRALIVGALLASAAFAHERLQGPTELLCGSGDPPRVIVLQGYGPAFAASLVVGDFAR